MINQVKKILNKKHLLICGKSESARFDFINKIVADSNFEVVRFPEKMRTLYEYLDYVEKNGLYKAWYQKKGSFNTNQILDFHEEWINDSYNTLVIMEEFDSMEEIWKTELIRIYLTELEDRKKSEPKIHLIVSLLEENGLMDKLAEVVSIKENERRNNIQVVQQNLELIEI
ncbi:MAG: hypothetical protein CMO01_21435 [Thalassobius sp.]|nr:hypothetical protein [Thalassovita sp.]